MSEDSQNAEKPGKGPKNVEKSPDHPQKKSAREERLAAALRDNLRRRKAGGKTKTVETE